MLAPIRPKTVENAFTLSEAMAALLRWVQRGAPPRAAGNATKKSISCVDGCRRTTA